MQLLALYFNLLNMMVMGVKAHSIGNLWYKLSNWRNTLFVPISFRKKLRGPRFVSNIIATPFISRSLHV